MRNAERIVGAHFFSPAHVMQLFEIIRTDRTPPQVLCDTLGLSKQIKKTPVVVGNCTGFAVNRVFFPYTMSACLLLDLGCDPYAIDGAVKMFGMPMGPFRLNDLVGTDIGVHVGKNFVEDFPDRVYESRIIPSLMEANRLGEKSGAGFYAFDAKRRAAPDPEGLAPFLAASRAAAAQRLRSQDGPLPALTQNDIVEMIFFPVVNEACRCLAEESSSKPATWTPRRCWAWASPPSAGGGRTGATRWARGASPPGSGSGARGTVGSTTRVRTSRTAPCRAARSRTGPSPDRTGPSCDESRVFF